MTAPSAAAPLDPAALAREPTRYYETAFARNLGLVDAAEQQTLARSRVAIAGLGGVGGIYALTLARMGVGGFDLADPDTFDVVNMNRQAGATRGSLGRAKVEAVRDMILEINPEATVRLRPMGVTADNADDFTAADLVIDAIDFFRLPAHRLLHRAARANGKWVLFSAPLGFSGTLHAFSPTSMSFDAYFDLRDHQSPFEQTAAFAVGLTPRGTHWAYLDASRVRLVERAGPSLASACAISAGLVATEALALLLGRRPPWAAPRYLQFDPYRRIFRYGRLWFGNRGLGQRLKRRLVMRRFAAQRAAFDALQLAEAAGQ